VVVYAEMVNNANATQGLQGKSHRTRPLLGPRFTLNPSTPKK
jgi:hypothetical protein